MLLKFSKQCRRSLACQHYHSLFTVDIKRNDKKNKLFHNRNANYFSGPVIVAMSVGLSAVGTYWRFRAHFNPITPRPFNELMNTNLIGQIINNNIKLPTLDKELQNEINEKRNEMIKKIRMRFEFQFLSL